MAEDFQYDVFLSHSSMDKSVVREIATRLREAGLRLWFDEWVLKPGDSIPAKIEEGLERSRVLVLCMSANAFGSDWAQLEAGTCGRGNLPFRDPLTRERCFRSALGPSAFSTQRILNAPIKGSLAQLLYINCRQAVRELDRLNRARGRIPFNTRYRLSTSKTRC